MTTQKLITISSILVAGSLFAADDAKSRMDAFLQKEFDGGALTCMSCAYEQHGETRYQFIAQDEEWAKKHDGKAFDKDTAVHVASITKVFTATLLMQLAEEGKISLLDSVDKYVPEFQGKNIPILNLMTHTSGWRNKTGHVAAIVDQKRHDDFYATMYSDFELNSRFQYMSQGYDILAEICEKVTGYADVADLVRDRIFAPLGMTQSAFASHQGQAGLHITAPDLVKFGRHLLDIKKTRKNGILTPESADALDRLAQMLRENPNVTIELSAHCDLRGDSLYNRRLSQRRAESVVRYLVQCGIDTLRLTPVGYGEDMPKTVNKKLTETYPWLHEGDVLTPQYIMGTDSNGVALLDTARQEVCHALNRRTEFRVLRTTFGLFDAKGNLIPSAIKMPAKKSENEESLKVEEEELPLEDEEDVEFEF